MEHIVKITKKPVLSGVQSIPDGAICGNGDLGIILGNCDDGLRVYISKCDLWEGIESHDKGGIKPLGYIDIPVSESLYSEYYVEQDMDKGELRCTFGTEKDCIKINLRPCKVENSIMIECEAKNDIKPVLKVFDGETSGEKGELNEKGVTGIYRKFSGGDHVYETSCYAYMKKVCDKKYYTFVATNHDTKDPKKTASEKASAITEKKYNELLNSHYEAWKSFWSKSAFETEDETLELGWYASQYFLAGCTGNTKFPPGLFANFITVENPSWHSDYHLNYNYEAPFYAACSSNHVEFTDCYHTPLEEFQERGREFADRWNSDGILYPVGLAPKGICSEMTPELKYSFERLFLGQKSNAIHAADIMVFRWNTTRDLDYAREHAYPYLKDCLEFFEDWVTFEKGIFSIREDAIHEVPYYKTDFNPKKYKKYIETKNNVLTLGLLRLCLPAAIDMAVALNVDDGKQEKWEYLLNLLAPFPTMFRSFKRVYRYSEKGQKWNKDNDCGLQHIYPCGCVGTVSSDPDTFKVAQNTFYLKSKTCWLDDNAVCSFYPMAARLAFYPDLITDKLHELCDKKQLPNMLFGLAGGCLENCPVFANTLNEMVMQSFEGVIRVFPCWNPEKYCKFTTLRADGAFLVSSEIKEGEVTYIEIICEKGGDLKVENPYMFARVEIDGRPLRTDSVVIDIPTKAGNKIRIMQGE